MGAYQPWTEAARTQQQAAQVLEALSVYEARKGANPLGSKAFWMWASGASAAEPFTLEVMTAFKCNGWTGPTTITPMRASFRKEMEEFKAGFPAFYEHTKRGTGASGECLYYGFAQEGNTVFCREGYKSAEGVLAHLDEVEEELGKAIKLVGEGGLKLTAIGPAAELVSLHTMTPQKQAAPMHPHDS